ncbi:PAS domain S-box protein [Roseobacter litoralis]|uniref:PAS domain S-box protein n=1 Tax=Roseobacter litoralis TaxID=42443 RepID=UPI003CD0D358
MDIKPDEVSSALLELPEDLPAIFHVSDRAGLIVRVSDRWLRTFGYDRDEVIGRRNCRCTPINQILRIERFFGGFCTLNCNIYTGCVSGPSSTLIAF